ncbi:hypothetical protein TNCT_258301, partial [Trichonephila clavata]
VQSNVAVGTPDYISPEILRAHQYSLQAMEDGKGRYGAECDWWSLGVLLRFSRMILLFSSEEAKDLMRRLFAVQNAARTKWFRRLQESSLVIGVNWATIRERFCSTSSNSVFSGLHLPFVGFTFSSKSRLSGFGVQNGIDYHTEENNYIYEQRIQKLEHDKMDLQRRLREMSKFFKQQGIIFDGEDYGKNRSTEAESRKLQDEINTLRKRKSELEMETSKLRKEHRDMMCGKQELDSLQDEKILRLRELEKALRFAKAENDELHRDLMDCHEKLKLQAKDLKDALGQRKLAMTEYAEVSDK